MTPPLTPETLVYDFPQVDDPQPSPDGRQLLYCLATVDRDSGHRYRTLWISDANGINATRLLPEGVTASSGRWSPNGDSVAFVEQVRGASIIRLVGLAGEEPSAITHHRWPIGSLAWSPDGKKLAYVCRFDPDNPEEVPPDPEATPPVRVVRRIDYKDDARGFVNDVRNHVFVVDVATGERRRLTRDYVDHGAPAWSPDGRWIGTSLPSLSGWGASSLLLIDLATGESRRIGADSGVVRGWCWSIDGDRVLFAGDELPTYQDDFFIYDLASGNTRRITDNLSCQPTGYPIWIDERHALFAGAEAGMSALYVLDTTTGALRVAARAEAVFGDPRLAVDSSTAVVAYTSFDQFRELAQVDLLNGHVELITTYGAATLEQAPPAIWERFEITRGAFTIEAWLLKPPDFDPSRSYPVVLDVHGGPHGFYGHKFDWLQQCLATHGFLVVIANPRGSTTYGRAFTTAVFDDWMGEDYLDLMAALDAVLERPYADRERTGIYGYSYGGHMTAWVIGNTQRFKAAVCGAPSFDLETQYATSSGDYDYGDIAWGGPPWTNYTWYVGRSPSTYAHRARTPTLIIHGEEDQGCPISQGEHLFTILKKVGCPVEFARYPGANHPFIDPLEGAPRHQEDFLRRTLGWFQRYLLAGDGDRRRIEEDR